MRYAVIDIGSNTMRINIYNYNSEKDSLSLLIHKKTVAGLASYVEKGTLSEKGINKTIKSLLRFKKMSDLMDVEETFAFATASLRNINNSKEAINKINKETGYEVELVAGEDEAKYGYLGATLKYDDVKDGALLDIGGGSSEVVVFKNGEIVSSKSLCEGSLLLYSKFVEGVIPTKSEINNIRSYVIDKIEGSSIKKIEAPTLLGIGGTIRATGNIASEFFDDTDHTIIDPNNIKEMICELKKSNKSMLRTVLQVTPERIHTITPGMIMFSELCKYFNTEKVLVSKKGVREGYLLSKTGLEEK